MAKRKSTSTEKAQTRNTDITDTAQENPFLLAESIVKQAKLDTIILVRCLASRTPNADPEACAPDISVSELKIGKSKDKKTLIFQPLFILMAKREDAAEADTDVKIECEFVVQYKCDDTTSFTEESMRAFGTTTVLYNVWPYWRELVQSMTPRMGLKSMVVPLLKF